MMTLWNDKYDTTPFFLGKRKFCVGELDIARFAGIADFFNRTIGMKPRYDTNVVVFSISMEYMFYVYLLTTFFWQKKVQEPSPRNY